jgi:hypothetical protein
LYLRHAKYGVFLLVRRGAQSDRKDWSIPGKGSADFPDLLAWLASEAASLTKQHSHVQDLQLVGIDLTARVTARIAPKSKPSTTAGRKKKPRPATHVRPGTRRHGK